MVQESTGMDAAPIIISLATLVTAVAGAFVLVLNALRTRRIESKVDDTVAKQDQIHAAVNTNVAYISRKIEEDIAEIAALKAAAVKEIAEHMERLDKRLEDRDRQNNYPKHRGRGRD